MKKEKNELVPVVIVLVIAMVVLAGLLIYQNQMTSKSTNKKDTTEKIEEKETDITSSTTKDALAKKVHFLTNSGDEGVTDLYTFRYGENSVFGNFTNMNDEFKLYTVLEYLNENDDFEPLKEENYTNETITKYVHNPTSTNVKQIAGTIVKEAYKKFFGTSNVTLMSTESYNCFAYFYDSTKDVFFKIQPSCGGSTASTIYSYNNRFTTKGDQAYVYVSYARSADEYKLYKDLDATELYKQYSSNEELIQFKLDATNYSDLTEYKFTFQKDSNGDYYFVKVEKTK